MLGSLGFKRVSNLVLKTSTRCVQTNSHHITRENPFKLSLKVAENLVAEIEGSNASQRGRQYDSTISKKTQNEISSKILFSKVLLENNQSNEITESSKLESVKTEPESIIEEDSHDKQWMAAINKFDIKAGAINEQLLKDKVNENHQLVKDWNELRRSLPKKYQQREESTIPKEERDFLRTGEAPFAVNPFIEKFSQDAVPLPKTNSISSNFAINKIDCNSFIQRSIISRYKTLAVGCTNFLVCALYRMNNTIGFVFKGKTFEDRYTTMYMETQRRDWKRMPFGIIWLAIPFTSVFDSLLFKYAPNAFPISLLNSFTYQNRLKHIDEYRLESAQSILNSIAKDLENSFDSKKDRKVIALAKFLRNEGSLVKSEAIESIEKIDTMLLAHYVKGFDIVKHLSDSTLKIIVKYLNTGRLGGYSKPRHGLYAWASQVITDDYLLTKQSEITPLEFYEALSFRGYTSIIAPPKSEILKRSIYDEGCIENSNTWILAYKKLGSHMNTSSELFSGIFKEIDNSNPLSMKTENELTDEDLIKRVNNTEDYAIALLIKVLKHAAEKNKTI